MLLSSEKNGGGKKMRGCQGGGLLTKSVFQKCRQLYIIAITCRLKEVGMTPAKKSRRRENVISDMAHVVIVNRHVFSLQKADD